MIPFVRINLEGNEAEEVDVCGRTRMMISD